MTDNHPRRRIRARQIGAIDLALADGDTLFVDEIGELPLDLRPNLLRALQEGEFRQLGSGRRNGSRT